MVKPQSSKLITRVRFPSSPPARRVPHRGALFCCPTFRYLRRALASGTPSSHQAWPPVFTGPRVRRDSDSRNVPMRTAWNASSSACAGSSLPKGSTVISTPRLSGCRRRPPTRAPLRPWPATVPRPGRRRLRRPTDGTRQPLREMCRRCGSVGAQVAADEPCQGAGCIGGPEPGHDAGRTPVGHQAASVGPEAQHTARSRRRQCCPPARPHPLERGDHQFTRPRPGAPYDGFTELVNAQVAGPAVQTP